MHEHLLSSAQLLVPVPSGGFFGVGARLLKQVPEPRVSAGRAAHVRPALPAAPSPPAARQRACEQEQPVVVGMVPAARARTGPTGARLLTQVPEPRVSAGRAAHVRPALPAAPSPPAARQRACEQEQPVVVGEVPGVRDCPFCLSHSVECGRCAMARLQKNH
jgi:hypothetical protein